MSEHKWFEGWELSVTGFDNGVVKIDVSLPHNDGPKQFIFHNSDKQDQIKLANLLDKALSELTGTKKGIANGSNAPTDVRRLGPSPA